MVYRLLLFVFVSVTLISCNREKVAYMDTKEVFNNFKYKMELEKELTQVKNQRKFILDSMAAELKLLSNKIKFNPKDLDAIAKFETNKEAYLEQKYFFEDEEDKMIKAYDAKIISQLNSYVKEFGKENNYSMIFGATSDGSIMFADTSLNISKDIIKYINSKYSGN